MEPTWDILANSKDKAEEKIQWRKKRSVVDFDAAAADVVVVDGGDGGARSATKLK